MDPETEVGEIRPGERDRTGGAHPLDGRRIARRDRVGEDRHAVGGRAPCDVDVLLHRARHTVQRAEHLVVRHGLVGAVGGGQSVVGQQADDGVDVLVDLEHTGEVGLHDLPTRHLLGGDFPGQFECSQLP